MDYGDYYSIGDYKGLLYASRQRRASSFSKSHAPRILFRNHCCLELLRKLRAVGILKAWIWEFPQIGVPYFGDLIIRILLFRVLY